MKIDLGSVLHFLVQKLQGIDVTFLQQKISDLREELVILKQLFKVSEVKAGPTLGKTNAKMLCGVFRCLSDTR